MAELEIIYDPALEMAAIINLDTRQGWGPSMVGASAKQILEAFINGTPFDLTLVDSETATKFFEDWFQAVSDQSDAAAGEGASVAPEPTADSTVAADTVPTAAQGAPTDEPPAPAPADADMGADTSATDTVAAPAAPVAVADPAAAAQAAADATTAAGGQVIDCPACSGAGDPNCALCKGAGHITVGP